MGKVNALTHGLQFGEVSRAGLNRVDKEPLRLYAERQENVLPYTIGKGLFRSGSEKIATAASRPRYLPFVKRIEDTAILEMTNLKLRVIVDDVLVTRPSVTSTVTNGDFSSGTGWTLTVSAGATGDINTSQPGMLFMQCYARGSSITCTRSVTTSNAGTQHALRIVIPVYSNEVYFRCGSTSGADDYISEAYLGPGEHSLAFTPSGTYHVHFKSKDEVPCYVDSIQVEAAGVMEITAPWTTAQLREVRRAQSQDVVFLCHNSWQQRKIERRGDASWSLVLYRPKDGPFTVGRTADLKLSASNTYSAITLTASSPFFQAGHAGALFRLDHGQMSQSWQLAGSGEYVDAWRVTGIYVNGVVSDRIWTAQVTGAWAGTITCQRSYDGKSTGFRDGPYKDSGPDPDFTANENFSNQADNGQDNNAIIWFRLGFKVGGYTSGTAVVNVQCGSHSGFGIARITSISSSTSAFAVIEGDANLIHSEQTEMWQEGDWSDVRGWPSAVAFFDGRLWWARKDRFWGSESNNYYKFNLETEGDSASVQRNIDTGSASNASKWILGLQRMILGTDTQEVSARSSSFDAPITPTEITLKTCSNYGSADVEPINAGARGVFISRDGTTLCELAYNADLQDYVTSELSRLNDEIGDSMNPDLYADGFCELALQFQPVPYLWAVRNDGVMCNMLYNPTEEARGLFKMITGAVSPLDSARPTDRVVSVAVLPTFGEDRVYIGVERTISNGAGGTTQAYYLEKMALHSEAITRIYNSTTKKVEVKNGAKMVDSYISTTGTSVVGQVITGLTHLAGRSVIICGQAVGGLYGPSETMYTVPDAGTITTLQAFSGTIYIGLPYEGFYKSAKLAYAAQGGTALAIPKKVHTLGLSLLDTHIDALRIGGDLDDVSLMDELPRLSSQLEEIDPFDNFSRAVEERPFPFPGEWNTDSRVCIYCRPGYSATISSIIIGLETAG